MTSPLRRATLWYRPLILLAGAMALLTVIALAGVFADHRVLTGAPIWMKVFKFSISIALYAATLAWMLSVLPQRRRWAERAATLVVAALTVEMIIIVAQVIRGRTSHFNAATSLDEQLFNIMGASIMVLWFAHLVIAIVVARTPLADRAAAYGIRLGLAVSLLGMLVAVPMTLPSAVSAGVPDVTGAHSIGVPDGGPGLPVVGWSTVGGDLRIGHFVGLHALQALPLLAWALAALARRTGRLAERLDETIRARLLVVAAGAYSVLVLLLTWQALRAQPMLRPDVLTLTGLAALMAATGVAVAAVLAARRRVPSPAVVAGADHELVR
jgi:hypothetical protein